MPRMPEFWDYLVLTASNDTQARSYEAQLALRKETGQLVRVRQTLVVADLEGKRIGSGASTLDCLARVVNREQRGEGAVEEVLRGLRILIVHAGGDSRRLPAYGPCGKIFVPVPGEGDGALGFTLFDRLMPAFLDLPAGRAGEGQVIVATGDALIRFESAPLAFGGDGIMVLGSYASPEEAARHGVFCMGAANAVRLYLQKPSQAEQAEMGAINAYGQAVLDIGVMSLDAVSAAALLEAFGVTAGPSGRLDWQPEMRERILSRGIDLYREICCALGTATTLQHYIRTARGSGSKWDEQALAAVFPALHRIPLRASVLPQCSFLHFGSTRQLVSSGIALGIGDRQISPGVTSVSVNNQMEGAGRIAGADAWVEGCRIGALLSLAGRNVVAGVDISTPLSLPEGACLGLIAGQTRQGRPGWFVECYGIEDTFKHAASQGAQFCGRPIMDWLEQVGAAPGDVWDPAESSAGRTLWNARVFPAGETPDSFLRWLWMYHPEDATPGQKQAFLAADRYSPADIAVLADPAAFHERRARIRAEEIRKSLGRVFSAATTFSAEDLALAMAHSCRRAPWVSEILQRAHAIACAPANGGGMEPFVFSRLMHSLGAALERLAADSTQPLEEAVPGLNAALPEATAAWTASLCILPAPGVSVGEWCLRVRQAAFRQMEECILRSSLESVERPRNAMRPDETIWGRGPARIELGGGWTDTPPYTLEFGGDVINSAVNLNGQPPIHCYCRVVEEPVVRLSSIDGGIHLEIRTLEELLDYRRPEDRFALAKAALAISGFSPEMAAWQPGVTLRAMLEEFGGGIELTTLVGIPKGSGLGTSSILGAVILAVIRRMMGRNPDLRAMFHDVLRLEQALTTGGGWQDQIGGGVGGSKITSTRPGMFPDPSIHYVPSDLLDPRLNGGSTLLYYTGITRLAKNILREIVGGYFNRNRAIMAALEEEHLVAHNIAGAMSRKDAVAFGHYVNVAWELQKRLCGTVTNEAIESLLARVRPHVLGMRISGAGSGGFLLMICKSPDDAARVRKMLDHEPLNDRARFFDFEINQAGLEVTTC